MGLFSNVLHVYRAPTDRVIGALDTQLSACGFLKAPPQSISSAGPSQLLLPSGPCYFVSPLNGDWLTIVEAHVLGFEGAPETATLASTISEALRTYALSLIVHDDDVLFYNLEHRGQSLDGYNSNPQYFENDPLSEEFIASQRHTPEAFTPILPRSVTVAELRALLDRGWWRAHDEGRLDEHGVPVDDEDLLDEGDRMTELGTLLQLHGSAGQYPYSAWSTSEAITWSSFRAIPYTPGPKRTRA